MMFDVEDDKHPCPAMHVREGNSVTWNREHRKAEHPVVCDAFFTMDPCFDHHENREL